MTFVVIRIHSRSIRYARTNYGLCPNVSAKKASFALQSFANYIEASLYSQRHRYYSLVFIEQAEASPRNSHYSLCFIGNLVSSIHSITAAFTERNRFRALEAPESERTMYKPCLKWSVRGRNVLYARKLEIICKRNICGMDDNYCS